jgi:pimeloyl-ACP methyl ester carboxylesterase
MEMQGELRTLSSRSKWVVANGSEHWIQIHRPDLVAAEIREVVNDARGSAPFQADPQTEYK